MAVFKFLLPVYMFSVQAQGAPSTIAVTESTESHPLAPSGRNLGFGDIPFFNQTTVEPALHFDKLDENGYPIKPKYSDPVHTEPHRPITHYNIAKRDLQSEVKGLYREVNSFIHQQMGRSWMNGMQNVPGQYYPQSGSYLAQYTGQYGSQNPGYYPAQLPVYCPPYCSYPAQTGVQYPPQTGVQYSPQASVQYPPQTGMQYPPQASVQYPPQAGMQYPPQASVQYPPQTGMQYPPQTGVQYTPQTGMQYPPQTGVQYPPQTGMQYPPQTGVQYPAQSGGQYPAQSGGQYPAQSGGQYPAQSGVPYSPQYPGTNRNVPRNLMETPNKNSSAVNQQSRSANSTSTD